MRDTRDLEIRFLKQDNDILKKELKDKQHQLKTMVCIAMLLLIFIVLVSLENMGVIGNV